MVESYSQKRPQTGPILNIPDPVIIKNASPCKALKVLDDYILLGLDTGEIKVYDKISLEELSVHQFLKFPVLKLSVAMIAIIAQFKDAKGTMLILSPPSAKNANTLSIVFKIETLLQSFTTLACTVIENKDQRGQIMIATPQYDKMHAPKVWLLNDNLQGLQQEISIENRNVSADNLEKKPSAKGNVKPTEAKKKSEIPPNGAIGCLLFNNNGNNRPELFVGYESGAIGAFRVWFDEIFGKLTYQQVLSTQKMVQDPNMHHVLSMDVIYLKPGEEDIKLVVGYYGQPLQTLDFTQASDFDSYILASSKLTEQTYSEKPGIGCISSIVIPKGKECKALIVSGGFDHRIRMISAKTLKSLVTLNFHQGIVNRVQIEKVKDKDDQVMVYSTSEDGYFCQWTLKI